MVALCPAGARGLPPGVPCLGCALGVQYMELQPAQLWEQAQESQPELIEPLVNIGVLLTRYFKTPHSKYSLPKP